MRNYRALPGRILGYLRRGFSVGIARATCVWEVAGWFAEFRADADRARDGRTREVEAVARANLDLSVDLIAPRSRADGHAIGRRNFQVEPGRFSHAGEHRDDSSAYTVT